MRKNFLDGAIIIAGLIFLFGGAVEIDKGLWWYAIGSTVYGAAFLLSGTLGRRYGLSPSAYLASWYKS